LEERIICGETFLNSKDNMESLTILLLELISFQRTTNDFNKTEKWKVIRTFTF
jgi:hypothetical protein